MRVLGIDEAGRSSVAGPMTIAGVMACTDLAAACLREIGVCDSKKIGVMKRKSLAIQIKRIVDVDWKISFVSAPVIDRYVARGRYIELEKQRIRRLIDRFDEPYLIFMHRIGKQGGVEGLRIVDSEDDEPTVAAASILATNARTEAMVRLNKKYPGLGCGQLYTQETWDFIQRHVTDLPPVIRKSWQPVQRYLSMLRDDER